MAQMTSDLAGLQDIAVNEMFCIIKQIREGAIIVEAASKTSADEHGRWSLQLQVVDLENKMGPPGA